MIEIFKDIKDLEGKYQVSNFGQILSLNYNHTGKPKLLKPRKDKIGYLTICIFKDRKKKNFKIHRLVAEAFLPNLDNLPCVNHKDENKENNFVGTPENDYKDGNLEWCTYEYNINYGTRNEKASKAKTNGKLSKKVLQFTLTGEFVREYPSMMEAQRNGFFQSAVSACCRGEKPQYKGFRWEYKED